MEDLAKTVVLFFFGVVWSGPTALFCSFSRFRALTRVLGLVAAMLGGFWIAATNTTAMHLVGAVTIGLGTVAFVRTLKDVE